MQNTLLIFLNSLKKSKFLYFNTEFLQSTNKGKRRNGLVGKSREFGEYANFH